MFGGIHKECFEEKLTIKSQKAELLNENLTVGSNDNRNRLYVNDLINNDTMILFICDSYFYIYIVYDVAESFKETICLHTSYLNDIEQLIGDYKRGIVVMENAERCLYNIGIFANYMVDNIFDKKIRSIGQTLMVIIT